MNSQIQEFDMIVIGGGSAGYAAARTSKAAGLRVAVVDAALELGGCAFCAAACPARR